MKITKDFQVDEEFINTRLDRWLKTNVQKFPQSFIEKSIRSGRIKVNNKKIKSSYKLQYQDTINLNLLFDDSRKESKKFSYNASLDEFEKIKKNIIFENLDYMILDKPSGIAVQSGTKSPKNIIDTLNKFSKQKKYYLVHRIDKETSGILVFACNRLFAQNLSDQFKNKIINKQYLAILHGTIAHNEGRLEHNLSIKEKGRVKIFKAESDFFVISKNEHFSYIQASLITGRKHQLRKQFFKINHPIVGDDKYFLPNNMKSKYLMLLSYQLSFEYQKKIKTYKIDPPLEFKNFLKKINL